MAKRSKVTVALAREIRGRRASGPHAWADVYVWVDATSSPRGEVVIEPIGVDSADVSRARDWILIALGRAELTWIDDSFYIRLSFDPSVVRKEDAVEVVQGALQVGMVGVVMKTQAIGKEVDFPKATLGVAGRRRPKE